MPSILSRLLGKKKHADPSPLLDGEKYEVVVPKTPSPSVPTFPDSVQRVMSSPKGKTKEQSDRSFGLPMRRKQPPSGVPTEPKVKEKLPMLSLHLPDPRPEEKRLQGLGVVFAGMTDGPLKLDDEVLGTKRLTAAETLTLVQKTSEVICERALETLGVMRPHWFASPRQQEAQLQLINRFLQTLSGSQTNGVATSSTSSPATFESELRYTRDPHDVAAVLRWGLRHLQLDGNSFGSTPSADWYRSFVDSERSGSYPFKAFDDFLVPLLPELHARLLCAILELVSSLAAHSEENGISGNKLSKVLGWWIVSSRNVQGLGWHEFYAQWDAAARQFEHLFLAYIRAQQAQSRMPKRLTELVKNYPYTRSRRENDGIFLPRSRFSTRSATALFVRITADKSHASSRPHPLRIVEDAFKAEAESDATNDFVALWQNIRAIASKPTPGDDSKDKLETAGAEASLNLSTVLADETIRLLSLVPAPDGPSGPTLSLFTSLPRRSYSAGDRSPTMPVVNGSTQGYTSPNDKPAGSPSISNRELEVATDWQAFSNAGFNSPSGLSLAASLWDTDTEVSQPTPKKGANAGKRNLSVKSGSPRRASADSAPVLPAPSSQPGRLTHGVPQIVKLDEAFIDFWADTLLDSIARPWPTFVVCQLKAIPTLRLMESDKPIEWLVIERVLVEPTRSLPPPVKTSAASARAASPTPASPTRSEGSKNRWTTASLAATRKRWSLFSHKHESAPVGQRGRDVTVRKSAMGANVGEMGEIPKEEDEGHPNGVAVNGRTGVNATGVNGVKEADVLEKGTGTKQETMPPLPAIHIEGASAPKDPAMTNREVINTKDATPTTLEATFHQDVLAVVNKLSDEPRQLIEATAQRQLPATAKTTFEPQFVTGPASKEEPASEFSPSQSQPPVAPEPRPVFGMLRSPVAPAAVAEILTSPKNNLVSPHSPEATTVSERQPSKEQAPDSPNPELKKERDISASDPPAKTEKSASRKPAALEDVTLKQPPSSAPDVSTSTEPEIPLPSKASTAESEPERASNAVATASVEETGRVISKKPEVIVAAGPKPQPKVIELAKEEGIDPSASPEVLAELEHAQEANNLDSHDAEAIPADENSANAGPAISEPHPEISTDSSAAVVKDTVKAAS